MKKLIIAIVTITILVVISTNYGKLYAMFFNQFSKDITQKTANIDFTIQGDFKGEKKINIQNLDQLIESDVKNYEIDIDFDIENNSDCEIYVRVAVVSIILDNTKANTAYKFSNSFCEIKYDSKNNTLDEDYWEKSDDGYYYYFGEDGKAVTGNFTFPDGATGMTDENGHVYTGCHRIGDLVYDFTSQGKLRHTVDATKPMVALTYDDGPSTQNTQIILDTLTANGAYATFFVLGRNVERCADLIQNIENSGSEIGNHTYNHYKITNMDAQVTDQEISSTSSYVQMITGNRPCIMRPPTGATDDASCANVAAVDDGYPLIMWCVDTIDWQHHDVATTCDIIRSKVKDGAIVLMHDMEASSAQASQIIIPELIAAGYELVTVSEMAAARGGMVPGQVYNYFDPALGQTQASTEIQPETNTSAETQVQQSEVETQAPTSEQSQSENQTEGSQTAESAPDTTSESNSSDDSLSIIFPWAK